MSSQIFNYRTFLKNFGLQEATTSFLLALWMMYTLKIRDALSINFGPAIHEILIIFSLVFNHVFYRLKHKQSNNFIGRIIHDHITIVLFIFFLYIYCTFISTEYVIKLKALFEIWLAAFFWIVALEILVALLRRVFNFVGCRPF